MKQLIILVIFLSSLVVNAQNGAGINIPELVSTKFVFAGDTLKQGYILAKKMDNLPYLHYGIVYGKSKTSRLVVSYGPTGLRVQDIKEFGDGKPVMLIKRKPIKVDAKKIMVLAKKSYDPIKNNCEHFVNETLTGEHISMQVEKSKKIYQTSKPMLNRYLKGIVKDTTYVNNGFKLIDLLIND